MKRSLALLSLAFGCGCSSVGWKEVEVTVFDPHDPKYWNSDYERHWEQHGYPDPLTAPLPVPWPQKTTE